MNRREFAFGLVAAGTSSQELINNRQIVNEAGADELVDHLTSEYIAKLRRGEFNLSHDFVYETLKGEDISARVVGYDKAITALVRVLSSPTGNELGYLESRLAMLFLNRAGDAQTLLNRASRILLGNSVYKNRASRDLTDFINEIASRFNEKPLF